VNKLVRLGDLLQVQNGFAFPSDNFVEPHLGFPLLRIRDLGTAQTQVGYVGEYREEFIVHRNDLLIGMDGNFECYRWDGPTALLNQRVCRLRNFSPELDPSYLYYWIAKKLREIHAQTSFITVKHISSRQILSLMIPLPPVDEQLRIAALLDRAALITDNTNAARGKVQAIIRALFLDTFGDPASNPKGWPLAEIGDLVERIDSGWSPVCGEGAPRQDQWGVLKLSAVRSTGFDGNEAKVLPNQSDARSELEVRDGDLLFTRKNTLGLVGTAAVVAGAPCRRMLPDTVFRLVPTKPARFKPEYLCALINLATFRPMIRQLASGSAASMPGISKGRLRRLAIALPPIDLQTAFAERVQFLEELSRRLDIAAAKAAAMSSALTSKLFAQAPKNGTGHVDAQAAE
jgi:type I restriction enzyme S subunit